jgi:hypothetical protein
MRKTKGFTQFHVLARMNSPVANFCAANDSWAIQRIDCAGVFKKSFNFDLCHRRPIHFRARSHVPVGFIGFSSEFLHVLPDAFELGRAPIQWRDILGVLQRALD